LFPEEQVKTALPIYEIPARISYIFFRDGSEGKMLVPNMSVLMLVFLLAAMPVMPADISSTGDWTNQVIGPANLTAGAGSALTATYESSATQITLDVYNTLAGSYDVAVKRTDSPTWDSSVILSVKRTDDGSGSGSISNGLAYQAVDTIDSILFSGTDDRSSVHLQLRLSNVSIQVPPDIYSTTLTFTVSP
jgi:hypothetical protein